MKSLSRVQALAVVMALEVGGMGAAVLDQGRNEEAGRGQSTAAGAADLRESNVVYESGPRTTIVFIKPDGSYAKKIKIPNLPEKPKASKAKPEPTA